MPVMQFRHALRAAMTEEMERDDNVFLMGEEVAQYNAAHIRYMSGGQFKCPVVFRGGNGIAHQLAATHSHRMESVYSRVPGLIVVHPSTPAQAKGLLKSAIRCDDPVIFLESEKMLA